MKKINPNIGLVSLVIGLMVWGVVFLLIGHPSLVIDENAKTMTDKIRKEFVFVRNLILAMGVVSALGMILGVIGLCIKKRDKTFQSHLIFSLTITGLFFTSCYVFFIVYIAVFF